MCHLIPSVFCLQQLSFTRVCCLPARDEWVKTTSTYPVKFRLSNVQNFQEYYQVENMHLLYLFNGKMFCVFNLCPSSSLTNFLMANFSQTTV